jgi:hypothetical protein
LNLQTNVCSETVGGQGAVAVDFEKAREGCYHGKPKQAQRRGICQLTHCSLNWRAGIIGRVRSVPFFRFCAGHDARLATLLLASFAFQTPAGAPVLQEDETTMATPNYRTPNADTKLPFKWQMSEGAAAQFFPGMEHAVNELPPAGSIDPWPLKRTRHPISARPYSHFGIDPSSVAV